MERSETLTKLRGEDQQNRHREDAEKKNSDAEEGTWALREVRFSATFRAKTPENAQRIILWCLASDPAKRPTASELLKVRRRYCCLRVTGRVLMPFLDFRVTCSHVKLKLNSTT